MSEEMKRDMEDQEVIRMANIPAERKFQRDLESSCTKAYNQVQKDEKRKQVLALVAKILWCALIAMALVYLAVAGQVAGWIANVGVCICIVVAAVIIDRRRRRK